MRDPWHFARADDAARLVGTLQVGLISAIAIIEPRRRGKTTFLLGDLQPAAQAAGLVPIYVNLAASTGGIEAHLSHAIGEGVAAAGGLLATLRRAGRTRIRKLTGKAGATGAELSAELEPAGADTGSLGAAFAALDRLQRPVLLLLDEVNRLGEDKAFDVAWSLRSLLDMRRTQVKVVATSSSAAAYELLVTGERRAFSRWFTRAAIEPLGAAFVRHLATITDRYYPRHHITEGELQQAFEELGRSPKFVRDYLNVRVLTPGLAHAQALREQALHAVRDSGFEDAFARLVPLQKVVLLAIASGQLEFFSAEALAAAGRVTTGAAVSKTLMQRAIRQLALAGWIIREGRGRYSLADLLLRRWLEEQVRAGALPPPADGGAALAR